MWDHSTYHVDLLLATQLKAVTTWCSWCGNGPTLARLMCRANVKPCNENQWSRVKAEVWLIVSNWTSFFSFPCQWPVVYRVRQVCALRQMTGVFVVCQGRCACSHVQKLSLRRYVKWRKYGEQYEAIYLTTTFKSMSFHIVQDVKLVLKSVIVWKLG